MPSEAKEKPAIEIRIPFSSLIHPIGDIHIETMNTITNDINVSFVSKAQTNFGNNSKMEISSGVSAFSECFCFTFSLYSLIILSINL